MKKEKVSFREKLAYGLGDAGCNFVWTTVGSFLTLYYTDYVGIAAAAVGTLMLLTRLLDGVTDLAMGAIIDKTNTRWGKARPWVLWSAVPMGVGLVLLFNVPTGFSLRGKIIYAYITYIFVAAIAYTASNLSYNTLLSLVTTDQNERASLSSIRFICTMVAVLFISFVTPILSSSIGWSKLSVIYGILAFILLMVTFLWTKERYMPNKDAKKPDLKEGINALFKNKYFALVTLIFVINYIRITLTQGTGIFFAKDILGNPEIFGFLTLSGLIPTIIGLTLFSGMAAKYGKWRLMMAGYFTSLVGFTVIASNPTSLPFVITGLAINGLGGVPHSAGLFALVADVVDYGEYKTGVRVDGLTYSATSFGMKVGTGIGSAMVGWVLGLGNYDGTAVTQPASALLAMKSLYIYIPMAVVVLGIIVLYFTNLDKSRTQVVAALEGKNK